MVKEERIESNRLVSCRLPRLPVHARGGPLTLAEPLKPRTRDASTRLIGQGPEQPFA